MEVIQEIKSKRVEDLPTNVHTKDSLLCLPEEFQSDNPKRPLQYYSDVDKKTYTYSLNPLFYSVIFILVIECLERFTYYGIVSVGDAFGFAFSTSL